MALGARYPVAPTGAAPAILTAARGCTLPLSARPASRAPDTSSTSVAAASAPDDPDPLISSLSHSLLHLPIDFVCTYTDIDLPQSVRDTISECAAQLLRTFHHTPAHPTLQSPLEAARSRPRNEVYVATTRLLTTLQASTAPGRRASQLPGGGRARAPIARDRQR